MLARELGIVFYSPTLLLFSTHPPTRVNWHGQLLPFPLCCLVSGFFSVSRGNYSSRGREFSAAVHKGGLVCVRIHVLSAVRDGHPDGQ